MKKLPITLIICLSVLLFVSIIFNIIYINNYYENNGKYRLNTFFNKDGSIFLRLSDKYARKNII